ncbi:MAG: Ig-like domain-containing protein, partial [Lachnospiraceae bacterium]|nr:Ig-like domain-containing protein [Lachnospiraceae bacterium]
MKKFLSTCIAVLGFVFFFALSSPDSPVTAYGRDTSDAESGVQAAETQAEIKLRVKTKALVKDTKYTLKVYNLSENQKAVFKSSDPETASVDENGVILGIANGTATITVTVKEGLRTVTTLTCEVTVGPPAINVKWTKPEIVLAEGKRTTLKTILLPYNTVESAKFYSVDPEVATGSSTGKITAKAPGTTY